MAAFLHHCPFLKSVPKPALRRTGTALLSLANQCPIIARQISVSVPASLEARLIGSPSKPRSHQLPTVDQRRLFAQTATQVAVAVSVSEGCPFVTSQIGMVRASPEVQEDVKEGRKNQPAVVTLQLNLNFNRSRFARYQREVKIVMCHTNRHAFLFHRSDDFSVEGFKGFNPPSISSKQHCHPPPQRQHEYVL